MSGSFLQTLHTVNVSDCLVYLQVTSAPGTSLNYSKVNSHHTLILEAALNMLLGLIFEAVLN